MKIQKITALILLLILFVPTMTLCQTASAWQTSWDAFLTLVEQELNRLPPNAPGPWEGQEVTWEGTVQDMEVMTAKNFVRLVFDMPERTLSIKGKPVTARGVMIFVPMTYENMADFSVQ